MEEFKKSLKNIKRFLIILSTSSLFLVFGLLIIFIGVVAVVLAGLGNSQYGDLGQSDSTLFISGADPNVQKVANNPYYLDAYRTMVNNHVVQAYRRNGKIDGYVYLDKVVAEMKKNGGSVQSAYEKIMTQYYTNEGKIMRPFQMGINMNQVTYISGVWDAKNHLGGQAHPGWDFVAPAMTPLYAPADGGKVTELKIPSKSNVSSGATSGACSMNNEIWMDYNFNGKLYRVVYAHLHPATANVIKKGDTLKKGQLVGYVGTTGCSTGNHLHYELRLDGVWSNNTDILTYTDLNTKFN